MGLCHNIFSYFSIITKLMVAKYKSKSNLGESTLSKTAISTSILLLSVSITFLILTIPGSVTWIMEQLNYSLDPTVFAVTMYLFYINHGISVALYCVCGPKFRKEAFKLLCFCQHGKVGPHTTASKGTTPVVEIQEGFCLHAGTHP